MLVWPVWVLLEHLGLSLAAQQLEAIMNRVLESGCKTPDLGGKANTAEVTQALIEEVGTRAKYLPYKN